MRNIVQHLETVKLTLKNRGTSIRTAVGHSKYGSSELRQVGNEATVAREVLCLASTAIIKSSTPPLQLA